MVTAVMSAPTAKSRAARFFQTAKLPKGFEWVDDLSPVNYRLFIIDLYQALAKVAIHEATAESVLELLDDWEATAEVDAEPELAAKLQTPRSNKNYREWKCA